MLVSIMVCQSARSTCCAGCGASARPALLTAIDLAEFGRQLRHHLPHRAGLAHVERGDMHRHLRRQLALQLFQTLAAPPVSTSAQPASAKRRAVARPKPEVAPVMNTIFCFMLFLFL